MGGGNGFPVYKGDILREFVHISLTYHPMSSKLRLYYELSRLHLFPLGTDTMFWPFGTFVMCSIYMYADRSQGWGVLLSAYSSDMPSPHLSWQLLMFGFTSMAIHSGACVVNDMLDRDFDRKVGKYNSPAGNLPYIYSLQNAPKIVHLLLEKLAWLRPLFSLFSGL